MNVNECGTGREVGEDVTSFGAFKFDLPRTLETCIFDDLLESHTQTWKVCNILLGF